MTLRATPAREPVVCLYAHPDDEFAVFAEIEAMVAEGRRVVCVYLTDGGFGGQPIEPRIAESRAVLNRLGVADNDVHFPGCTLGFKDGALVRHLADATEAARRLIAPGRQGFRLLIPAWEGGHQDHDAAHLVGLSLAREYRDAAEVLQFSIYQGRGLPGSFFRVMSPIPENGAVIARAVPWKNRLRHLRYCLSYPSQPRTWAGLFPLVLANYLAVGTQRLQRVEPSRVKEPPHAGVLLYERRGFLTYKEFAELTEEIRAVVAQ